MKNKRLWAATWAVAIGLSLTLQAMAETTLATGAVNDVGKQVSGSITDSEPSLGFAISAADVVPLAIEQVQFATQGKIEPGRSDYTAGLYPTPQDPTDRHTTVPQQGAIPLLPNYHNLPS